MKLICKRRFALILFCSLLATLSSVTNALPFQPGNKSGAQSPQGVPAARVETVDFESKLVGSKLPYIVVLPPGYDDASSRSVRYPVIYLLHGFGGNPRNWLGFDLIKHAARHRMIFVALEGRNSFYSDSATVPNEKFESYIMRELVPDVDRRFRTTPRREGRAVVGLSMGGYGALKLGLKYPSEFALAASMSGAVRSASYQRESDITQSFREVLVRIFGAADGKTKIENDLLRLVREFPTERRAELPFIYLDCGTEDFLFESNRAFANLLTEAKIKHEYRELPGSHTGKYWAQQLPEIIEVAARVVSVPTAATAAAATAAQGR